MQCRSNRFGASGDEFRLADGIVLRPMGQGVRGLLIYDRSGYMMLHVMDPDCSRFQSGDWLRGEPSEILELGLVKETTIRSGDSG